MIRYSAIRSGVLALAAGSFAFSAVNSGPLVFRPVPPSSGVPSAAVATFVAVSPSVTGALSVVPPSAVGTWTALSPSVSLGGVIASGSTGGGLGYAPINSGLFVLGRGSFAPSFVQSKPLAYRNTGTVPPASAQFIAVDPTVTSVVSASPSAASASWIALSPTLNFIASPSPAVEAWTALDAATSEGSVTASPGSAQNVWSVPTPVIEYTHVGVASRFVSTQSRSIDGSQPFGMWKESKRAAITVSALNLVDSGNGYYTVAASARDAGFIEQVDYYTVEPGTDTDLRLAKKSDEVLIY